MTGTQAGPAFYDDDSLNYQEYWSGRGYEHQAEVLAVRKLLRGRRFGEAIDVGGGYGRLSVVLAEFAEEVLLVDPSQQQLSLAASFLSGQPRISWRQGKAAALPVPDASADLACLVRVLHHLPDPAAELAELRRVLRPGGTAILEVANVAHAMNRIRYLARRQPVPVSPTDVRTGLARETGGIPFVNHHPATVIGQLTTAGLRVERTLSVSNLRLPALKKVLPGLALVVAEGLLQDVLAPAYFGPSIFFRLRRR
jgi:SAM-dependent methyltransferase